MPVDPEMKVLQAATPWRIPEWAVLEIQLIQTLHSAAKYFVDAYTRPDRTLVWRTEWPGMDGSDDPYEGFQNFALLSSISGDDSAYRLAQEMWESVTWQWTEYGQVYREFDAYYDWMHHGEGSLLFYFSSLVNPSSLKALQRAVRFADFYTGSDPSAPNYDRDKRMMRSPINGSRGPRFQMTAEDWSTHRAVLDNYPPPFEDIPGVTGPTCPWSDDAVYEHILQRMNSRMARGDVPLNLTSTSLVTHAFMCSREDKYRQHVLDYLDAWKTRAERNGGIVPDNVGPSDIIGEYMGGNWWGGYYGWRWPHGAMNIIESTLVAGSNALLLDGNPGHLDLVRSQLDLLQSLGKREGGSWFVPHKHRDAGWTDYRPLSSVYPIYCWYLSMDDRDLERVHKMCDLASCQSPAESLVKGHIGNTAQWFQYITGHNPDYPKQILLQTLAYVSRLFQEMRAGQPDPESWDIHHWQDMNPVVCEGLVQLMLGAPIHIYHGGLLHARLRYFDGERRCPGLPPSVGALVEDIRNDRIVVTLVNTDLLHAKHVVIQAGTFGEHRFETVGVMGEDGRPHEEVSIAQKWVAVQLAPGSGIRLVMAISRYVFVPTYETPWVRQEDYPPLIRGRRVE